MARLIAIISTHNPFIIKEVHRRLQDIEQKWNARATEQSEELHIESGIGGTERTQEDVRLISYLFACEVDPWEEVLKKWIFLHCPEGKFMTSSYPFAAAKWMIDGTEEIYLYMPLTPKLGLLRECPRYEPIRGKENFELFVTGTSIRDFHNFKIKTKPRLNKLYKSGAFETRHQYQTVDSQQIDYLNFVIATESTIGENILIFPPICDRSSKNFFAYRSLIVNPHFQLKLKRVSEKEEIYNEISVRNFLGRMRYFAKTFKEEPNAEDNS